MDVSVRDAKMFEIENEKDLITNIAAEEFKSNRIRTFLVEKELDLALKNLYRSAKVSMEENGSNSLFLALGLRAGLKATFPKSQDLRLLCLFLLTS